MTTVSERETTQQPTVDPFIEHLARRFGCTRMLELTRARRFSSGILRETRVRRTLLLSASFEHELDSTRCVD
jgi:hypothetical protein